MKQFFLPCLVSAALLLPFIASAQTPSCCKATERFAKLGDDEKFRQAHPDPVPMHYEATSGKMVSIPVKGGKNANIFEIVPDKPTQRYLIVVHEWYGLNDYIKREAERLQKELDVHVIAVDLFDGRVAENAEQAAQYMKEAKENRVRAILQGAIAYAGPQAKIETIGWCYGGGWSLQASIMAGKQGTGCVMFYGMPEQDVAKLKTLNAPVLGIFAVKDEWITPDIVSQFLHNMKENGKDVMLQSYTADHGFANPSNPKYNKEAADDANKLAMQFLKDHLK